MCLTDSSLHFPPSSSPLHHDTTQQQWSGNIDSIARSLELTYGNLQCLFHLVFGWTVYAYSKNDFVFCRPLCWLPPSASVYMFETHDMKVLCIPRLCFISLAAQWLPAVGQTIRTHTSRKISQQELRLRIGTTCVLVLFFFSIMNIIIINFTVPDNGNHTKKTNKRIFGLWSSSEHKKKK